MKKVKIVVCGALGRMGLKVLEEIAKFEGVQVSGAVDIKSSTDAHLREGQITVKSPEFFSELIKKSDVAIDFTTPESSIKFAKECVVIRKPIVIGTTGFKESELKQLKNLSKKIPILISPNMSPAVNLTFIISKIIARKLPNFDIHITETHHKMKKDAPSGTAIKYLNYIKSICDKDINITSIRAGDIIGEHTILFAGPHESVVLTHRAHSREVFARGSIFAAKWLVGKKPGIYDYMDVLGLKNLE